MTSRPWTAPLRFRPVYKEKVWGGRSLETVYGRTLPDGQNYGESWELVDRPGEQVVVRSGPAAGKTLHDLWVRDRISVFGPGLQNHRSPRFPLLVKILDARDDLSIQVHPPAAVAAALQGEPKTEIWYIARAEPGAKLYVGLRPGVSREAFEAGIADGNTPNQVHAITPRAGESLFIPSGRLHAIGAGLLIYEIQQNSDTTYRVYDWDRPGSDGKPRALHVEESLRCIDFADVAPQMDVARGEILADCEYFQVRRRKVALGTATPAAGEEAAAIVTVLAGTIQSGDIRFGPGDFFLVPAQADARVRHLTARDGDAEVLLTGLPPVP